MLENKELTNEEVKEEKRGNTGKSAIYEKMIVEKPKEVG